MDNIILFLMTFVFVFIVYQIFIVSKAKKNHAKKKRKDPIEVKYLISRYKLNLRKVSYNQLLQLVAIVSSLDISIIVTVALLVDTFLLQMLLAIVVSIPLILFSYHLIGLFYKKKGMVKND